MTNDSEPRIQGAVLHVSDLEPATAFYTELLGLEVARRTADAVILATRAGAFSLALRQRPVRRVTDRTVQALVWRVASLDRLDRIEQQLAGLGAKSTRHVLAEDPTTLVSTWDPDGQRVVFVHHDGEEDVPQTIPPEVFWY
ncbi:VOC family protein [Jiangella mangrovi]|uniref:Catechol-2,3-dioxygenase n=1 Tax=Jiangella mangrovi TaxID=1524084 RepID=A0A7W9LPE4_9ACTN|nr:VOC family protein [Jiangella mangrovi]MBB5791216.1 catechol-2,3-dioxygenase [Jiangella mangrovi]